MNFQVVFHGKKPESGQKSDFLFERVADQRRYGRSPGQTDRSSGSDRSHRKPQEERDRRQSAGDSQEDQISGDHEDRFGKVVSRSAGRIS